MESEGPRVAIDTGSLATCAVVRFSGLAESDRRGVMKRAYVVLLGGLLLLALGAQPAFAAGHVAAASVPDKVAGQATAPNGFRSVPTAGLKSFADYAPLAVRPLSVAGLARLRGMSLTFGGGTNISDAVELPLPSDLPSGTVDAVTHPDDVYLFYLEQGGEMVFHLNLATPGSQVALRLYSPGTNDISVDSPWLSDTGYSYPTDDAFVAPVSGYYYINVHAVTGGSAYTMDYDSYYAPNDNVRVDGALAPRITASAVSNWLDVVWNADDVYTVPLHSGDRLSLSLSPIMAYSSPDIDLDLFLYGPSATDIYPQDPNANAGMVAHSAQDAPAVEKIAYTAPTSGNYFVDVSAYAGWGPSSLTWSVNPIRPSISRTPSAAKLTYTRKKGVAKFTLGARFTSQVGLPITGATVYLQTSSNGKTWKSTYKLGTNSNGSVSKAFSAKKASVTYYRWYRAASSTSKSATSSTQKVTIK
jgi:hypothetical protein